MIRAPRAYIAGFGTAGSLVAGAAGLFVLASAAVSFQGWPQLDAGTAPPAMVLASYQPPTRSAATERVTTVLAARQTELAAVPGPAGAPGRAAVAARRSRTPSASGLQPALTIPATNPTGTAATTLATPPPVHAGGPTSCQSCGGRVSGGGGASGTWGGSGAGGAASSTTGTLGGVVSGTGSHLGSVLGGATSSLGARLGVIVPGAGSTGRTLGSTGQVLGGVLGGVLGHSVEPLGGAVGGTGHLLAGPLGAH